jgi:glycosyltransferase involved in cell wall biosynthesis
VFVGTLEPRKGLPGLLSALRLLHDDDPDTPPLVLAGPPGWGPAPETAGLPPGAVVPAGYLEPAALRGLVAGAAALVFPSLYEGFGLPPLEAFATGTPVVASDIPVIREVTGGLATLAPVGDAAALADALRSVLADPGDREARRAYARGFTWAATAAATAAAYRRAAGR